MKILIQNHTIIDIVPYSESVKTDWEMFVNHEAINSTFLHSRAFFDHNLLNARDDSSLLFYKGGKVIAVFPAVIYVENNKRILHSHLRATYGGFVISNKVGIEAAVDIIEQTISFAREKNVAQIIVRNPFRIFNSELCDETDYAMWFHGFKIKSRELEIVIPLYPDVKNNKIRYHLNCQRSIKKSRQLVEVRESNDFKSYWMLLEKSLLDRHGSKPVHDYNSIYKLRKEVGENKVLLFNAYHNEKLIGGIVVFDFDGLVMHSQYLATDYNFKHLCPVHAVIDYLIVRGSERGFQYLSLGMANEDEGKKINSGLFHFKEGFGGRGVLRETMYLDL